MDREEYGVDDGARLVFLRGQGRETLTLKTSPRRLLMGFLGVGVCPAFCLGLLASQMGLSTASAEAPSLLSSTGIFAGLMDSERAAGFQVLPSAAPAPPALPPPPVVAVAELQVSDMTFRTPEARRGLLRVMSLHLGESISVRPFDEQGMPDPDAFEEIARLWRCRVTGHEQPINPRLVRLLTTLNDIYDRPVHLISGHRVADTLETKSTSQHVAGTAADVRIPGVSAIRLRAVAKALGARGVGLYTHKSFVHVDFRNKRRYFWVYPEVPTDQQRSVGMDENQVAKAEDEAPDERVSNGEGEPAVQPAPPSSQPSIEGQARLDDPSVHSPLMRAPSPENGPIARIHTEAEVRL